MKTTVCLAFEQLKPKDGLMWREVRSKLIPMPRQPSVSGYITISCQKSRQDFRDRKNHSSIFAVEMYELKTAFANRVAPRGGGGVRNENSSVNFRLLSGGAGAQLLLQQCRARHLRLPQGLNNTLFVPTSTYYIHCVDLILRILLY